MTTLEGDGNMCAAAKDKPVHPFIHGFGAGVCFCIFVWVCFGFTGPPPKDAAVSFGAFLTTLLFLLAGGIISLGYFGLRQKIVEPPQ